MPTVYIKLANNKLSRLVGRHSLELLLGVLSESLAVMLSSVIPQIREPTCKNKYW